MQLAALIVVTGGLGFIGKHVLRRMLEQGRHVKNNDSVSYAADHKAKRESECNPNYRFQRADIAMLDFLPQWCAAAVSSLVAICAHHPFSAGKICAIALIGIGVIWLALE